MLMQIVYHSGGGIQNRLSRKYNSSIFRVSCKRHSANTGCAETSLDVSLYTFLCRLVRKNTEKVRTV